MGYPKIREFRGMDLAVVLPFPVLEGNKPVRRKFLFY